MAPSLIHPVREGRSKQQIGRKGKSNKRWIVGAKLYVLLNQCGQVVDWDCDSANVADNHFTRRIEPYAEEMIVLTDQGFHRALPLGDPANLKVCGHKQWSERMLVERRRLLPCAERMRRMVATTRWRIAAGGRVRRVPGYR